MWVKAGRTDAYIKRCRFGFSKTNPTYGWQHVTIFLGSTSSGFRPNSPQFGPVAIARWDGWGSSLLLALMRIMFVKVLIVVNVVGQLTFKAFFLQGKFDFLCTTFYLEIK